MATLIYLFYTNVLLLLSPNITFGVNIKHGYNNFFKSVKCYLYHDKNLCVEKYGELFFCFVGFDNAILCGDFNQSPDTEGKTILQFEPVYLNLIND